MALCCVAAVTPLGTAAAAPLELVGGGPQSPAKPRDIGSEQGNPLLVCPVDPPRHYIDDFGQPRYVGGFHRHDGIDIMAPLGTVVRAPFDGIATNSTNWQGGITVKVQGRWGFVYDAHLSRQGSLGHVHAGDVVGYVGNTGDASGGATHDHFEWHPGNGSAADSYRYLNGVCRGPSDGTEVRGAKLLL
jgi:murein DD-endopeptidase MepM/ murein hydrolase activator NlpD